MLPYRKDDISLTWSHPNYDYFARRGIGMARVDVRGTGSSEGEAPHREYSETEIQDGVDVIAALAELDWSNGSVGMWGISWGGFNAIQVALQNPPQLKAILAAHASDDLYLNDVHYTDGVFGLDEYILSINHMMGFMQSPDYAIDDDYFANRFDREPWLFTYLRNSRDGDFWRQGSLKYQADKLQIPVFLVNGLLDGYRDIVPNSLGSLDVPVRAVLGPWPHAWPTAATPGPSWEWRDEAVNWWSHWLGRAGSERRFEENSFRFFLRSGNPPDTNLSDVPGEWFQSSWPLPAEESAILRLFPGADAKLSDAVVKEESESVLLFQPTTGHELGEWWGELLPNMAIVDASSLSFDSEPFQQATHLVGNGRVALKVKTPSAKANWHVRLEDVDPDGRVTVITGGSINGLLRESTLEQTNITPNQFFQIQLPLHFSTWTFQPGHRVRVAVSNGIFPMYWPTAELTETTLAINSRDTRIELPLWTAADSQAPISMPAAKASANLPVDQATFEAIPGFQNRNEVVENKLAGTLSVIRESAIGYVYGDETRLHTLRSTKHTTSRSNPADTSYEAWAEYRLIRESERIVYRTEIDLASDADNFQLSIIRTLSLGDEEIRRRQWQQEIPRGIH